MAVDFSDFKVRHIKKGDWYWVSRSITQGFATKIGLHAFAVYHFLASMVNDAQRCFPSQRLIARRLGCSRSSVNKAVKILENENMIFVEKINQRCIYYLLEMSSSGDEQGWLRSDTTLVNNEDTNDIHLNKYNNDYDSFSFKRSEKTKPLMEDEKNKIELLGHDLAEGLNDMKNLPIYIFYSKKYPEELLRKILSLVKQTPAEKIKKSRGALFTFLLKKYGNHS